MNLLEEFTGLRKAYDHEKKQIKNQKGERTLGAGSQVSLPCRVTQTPFLLQGEYVTARVKWCHPGAVTHVGIQGLSLRGSVSACNTS